MICPACGAENKAGRKFCSRCGSGLALACPACGAANDPDDAFCGECGSALTAQTSAPVVQPLATAERRLVSVLFADLVGFTALSEGRDAEEVRELLSRYFDSCRRLIDLYGGTVEKFIGDAVMAVWGTPTAQEDDAERAVRAALDLTAAVSALGDEIGAPELRARAGVLTGEAAVNVGAQGQGMVAGDLVNTASRIQSAATPGTVLVGEATKRATQAAIEYADAGEHELKGKAEPVPLFRAVRVTGGRGGAYKSEGLEPPFVGRERELRLLKEVFHVAADERKAHLVSAIGTAGIGKSRLSWEFFKYVDGLVEGIWWHRGRCLAYGEGVTYWALAEMVRMRSGIVELEEPESARAKLHASLEEYLSDAEERAWVEPRLAQLLGLEERTAGEREDLFAAWRLFFERLAEQSPLILVFEDMQWADTSLLEFVEYLLDWSRNHPIFVLTLARPELQEHHPSWGAGKRNFTAISLEPLGEESMRALLEGTVPGLPEQLLAQILDRAEGVPLYAVETVRMLLDRGLLERHGDVYRATGEIAQLDVPETLHALLAARLDGLSPAERALLQDGSVLGKTFTKESLAAFGGADGQELDALLGSLVRKEVLFVQADHRSPERGQYGFLQDLLRHVAYQTLAKRERKARHLAAAAYLEQAYSEAEQEIVEVLASHYLDAYEAVPDADDAPEIRAKTCEMLARAGERAASLAAREEASRYFEQAAGLADDPLAEARLLERAAEAAWAAGHGSTARERFERAIELFTEQGQTHPAARVAAARSEITWAEGHIDQAVEAMERSFAVLAEDRPDGDLAMLAAQLGRLLYFVGEPVRAHERIEQALQMAEALGLPEVLSEALDTKGVILSQVFLRPVEGGALTRHALQVALDAGIPHSALRAYFNLSCYTYYEDRYDDCLALSREGLAYARRYGDRNWESSLLSTIVGTLTVRGDWDEALTLAEKLSGPDELDAGEEVTSLRFAAVEFLCAVPPIHVARGRIEDGEQFVRRFAEFGESADMQERTAYNAATSVILAGRGQHEGALTAGLAAFAGRESLGASFFGVKLGFAAAAGAALALGDLDEVERLLAIVADFGQGESTPFLDAQAKRFRARVAASRGDGPAAAASFVAAAAQLREIGLTFWLAVTELEHGEWLAAQERHEDAAPLLAAARETFERLEAAPWLERAELAGRQPAAV